MFYDAKKNELLLRLYAKSRTIGHVPSFAEMNSMPDMPAANTFALHCGSYANAMSSVNALLSAKKPPRKKRLPEDLQKEIDIQERRMQEGWIPIKSCNSGKSLREMLDEVMQMANPEGILPREFPISIELKERLNDYCGPGMAY